MRYDVGIIGGGVIGLACAWRLAQAGAQVAVFERGQVGHEASWAAAGMLAAQCEMAHYPPNEMGAGAKRQQSMFELCLQSRAMYADFATELLDVTNIDIELSLQGHTPNDWRKPGILYVLGRHDEAAVESLKLQGQHSDLSPFTSSEAAALGPMIASAPFVTEENAFWMSTEGQVENRKLVAALSAAAIQAGTHIYPCEPVKSVQVEAARITALVTSGRSVECEKILLCAGAWSGRIQNLPPVCVPPVKPVAGQMIALHQWVNNFRSIVYSHDVYLVPRRDGRLLVGATMESRGFDKSVTVNGVTRLLEAAKALIPALADSPIAAQWAGLRPGTPDGLPILGRTSIENLYIATGHFRNGILLTPVTAKLMADCILAGADPPAEFRLQRFHEN